MTRREPNGRFPGFEGGQSLLEFPGPAFSRALCSAPSFSTWAATPAAAHENMPANFRADLSFSR